MGTGVLKLSDDGSTFTPIHGNAGGGGGGGDVTAAANITDHAIVRGDGGAKGVQGSGVLIDDDDNVNIPGDLALTGHAHFGTEVANTSSGGTATIDWTAGNKQKLTLSEDITTLNFTAPTGVGNFTLRVITVGTAYTIAWPAAVDFTKADGAPVLSSLNDYYLIPFYYFYDGSDHYGAGYLGPY